MLRSREKITCAKSAAEAPGWQGAMSEHTRRYVSDERRSQPGWIDRAPARVIFERRLSRGILASALAGLALSAMSGRAAAAEEVAAAKAAAPDAGATDASSAEAGEPGSPSVEPEASASAGLFEQSQSAASASARAGTDGFKLSGYVRGDMYVGKVTGANQGDIKAGYGEAALIARTKKEQYGDGFAELRLRYGMQGETQQQAFVDVREAYVNTYAGPVDLRLGKQIIVWGRADLLNPTNNLTPFNLRARSPIEDDRRVGNVGARAFLRLAPVRLEGVWMPMYAATELPPVALPKYVSYTDPNYPKPELDKGLLAGRVHLELPGFEMSGSYLHGYAPLPGLTLSGVTVDPNNPSVLIARTAYKQQVVGFDFSTAIGELLAIRGEAAYRRPYDYKELINAPKPDLQYALGGDHTFGSVSVIVQYLGRYAFDWTKATGPAMALNTDSIKADPTQFLISASTAAVTSQLAKTNQILFSQTARVQHLATMRVEWLTAHDTLSLSALGMVNFTTKEWLAAPKLGYRLSDALTATIGAEILTGPRDTLFGMVDQKMSAGYAELRSTF
jgi:hypothetical protein